MVPSEPAEGREKAGEKEYEIIGNHPRNYTASHPTIVRPSDLAKYYLSVVFQE